MTLTARTGRCVSVVGLLAVLAGFVAEADAGVSGRVLDTDGKPVAGATVGAYVRESAMDQGERLAAGQPRTAVATVRSGADGAFKLDATRPFSWIEARADGFLPAVATVAEDGPSTLTLHRSVPKRGVVRGGGKPVAGATVVWTTGGAETLVRTGADGAYEIPYADTAYGTVQVIHPDFAPLDSSLRGKAPDLDLEMHRGVAVVGTVVDAAGRPLTGATVYIDGNLAAARTDAKGQFSVLHVPADWSYMTTRTDRLAGTAARRTGAMVLTAKPARTVSGVVREEKTGQPVATAMVTASTGQGIALWADTDAQGRYTITGMPAGRYRLYAGRDGFASGPADYGTADPLDLRETVSARKDFALTRHPRLTGRVEDEERRPVDGALVSLGFKDTPPIYAHGLEDADLGSTRTGADGAFTLVLAETTEDVNPLLKDGSVTALKPGYAAGQASQKAAAGAPTVIRLTRGLELKGRVTTADGAPVAGVAVFAAEDGTFAGTTMPMHMILAHASGEGWTATDAAGRFSLRVRPAVHHLAFRKAGHAPKTVRGHDPRTADTLDVTLDPAAVLRGRVSRADGAGVPEVTVTALQEMSAVSANATTGPDGAFELGDLAPGLYHLTATNHELGIRQTRTVEAPAADVQIVLGPTGTLRGRVVDAAEARPVPRFKVRLPGDTETGRGGREVPVEDAAGAFSIADAPLGDIAVVVTAEGYAARSVEVTVTSDADGPELEVALDPEALISGRVTSEAKAAVPDARVAVEAKGAAEQVTATTDDDGAYELRGVAPGALTLRVTAEGYLSEKRTLDTHESTRADVTLRKGLALRGEVVYEGAGVAQAMVSATSSAQGATSQSAQTDERGRFTLEGLVPGRYTVNAYAQGKGKAELEDVDAERAGALRLVLEKGATAILTGKVVGLPAEEGFVAAVMATGEEGGQAYTMVDATHSFRMEDAPAGRVEVRAMANDMSGRMRTSRSVELTLAAGSETETVLRFAGDVVITGVVIRDGAPVPGAMVGFSTGGDMGSMGRTDGRGAYEVSGLEPGTYQVTVSGDNVTFNTTYVASASGEFDIDITGGSVSGRAVRADDGTPIDDVSVSFFRVGENENNPATSATTNAQGAFTARSLHEGQYRLMTAKAGFGQVLRVVDVPRGGTAEVVLELSEADGISVTVIDARDNRVLDAIVVVRDLARQIVANQHSGLGADGVLNIPLAPGSYLLSTSATGYGTVTRPVTAPAQGLRVGLTPGGTLKIESPRDLRGKVRLIQPDGEEYIRCWCNGIAEIQLKGRWTTVENITPGNYSVELVDGGIPRKPVLIQEGQTSSVTLE